MRPKVGGAHSSSSSSAPTATWSACRSTKPWRCLPVKGFRPTSAGSTPRNPRPRERPVTLSFDFAENVDLDAAGKHLPPSLQEGLQAGITGDLLAACLQ